MKMRRFYKILPWVVGLALFVGWQAASADQSTTFGNYVIYYNAFNSDLIDAEVAKKYELRRAKNWGLVNISVKHNSEGSDTESVTAKVSAKATNLTLQQRSLEFVEIKEGRSIYYLSGFRFTNEETFDFVVKVTPTGSTESHTFKFRKKFYVN